jgi:hypothetical protein
MTPQERADFIDDIALALSTKQEPTEVLSDDEVRALKLFIKKQEQSIALRQSIIEKSLTALLIAAALGLFGMATGWFTTHMYRP